MNEHGNSLCERDRRKSLILSLFLHGMNHAMYNMLTPLVLTLTGYFRFESITKVTLGFSLYLGVYGFAQIPVGFLSDRVSRKNLLASGAVINGSAIALCASFPSYTVFLVGMFCAGLGASTFHPVNASYLSDLYRNKRGSALGLSGFGATAGLFLGPLIGGALCESIGWRKTFIIFSIVSILVGIIFCLFAKEPERELFDKLDSTNHWNKGIIVFLAIAATIFTLREFAGWGGYFLLPVFSESIYGYSVRYAGFIGGLQTIGGFIAQPLGGFLSDRFGRRRLMSVLLFFVSAFMILIPFAGRTFLIPVVLMYGICYTATVPIIDALIADKTPAKIRGGVFGIFMASGIGISAFSQLTQAAILDSTKHSMSGYYACFFLLGGVVFLSMVVLLLFKNAEAKDDVVILGKG